MRIILVRHGETIENAEGIVQGHHHGRLSDIGIDQARRVARRLGEERIDAIYSSDLERAADTAREIARYHKHAEVHFTERLRERFMGDFQGRNKKDFDWKSLRNAINRNINYSVGNIETVSDLSKRAKSFFHELLERHRNDTILIVSHGLILRTIIALIMNKPPEKTHELERLGNASVTMFDVSEDKGHRLHAYNCTRHLDNDARVEEKKASK
jgi:broad specificity phosphatase PhoE